MADLRVFGTDFTGVSGIKASTPLGVTLTFLQATEEIEVDDDGAVTQALEAGKIYHFTGTLTSLTITLTAPTEGLAQYHFDFDSGSTAPTLANSNAFGNMQTSCIIYVPYSEDHSILDAYKAASNWSTKASQMQEEPQ